MDRSCDASANRTCDANGCEADGCEADASVLLAAATALDILLMVSVSVTAAAAVVLLLLLLLVGGGAIHLLSGVEERPNRFPSLSSTSGVRCVQTARESLEWRR